MGVFRGDKKKNIIIVGCGRFGSAIAAMLSERNRNVTVIDINQNAFRKLPSSYGGFTIEADGSDIDALTRVRASKADLIVASTGDDNLNIMVAQIAKQIFGVKQVVARLQDPSKQAAFNDLDIEAIYPALLCVREFERIINEN